MRLLNPTFLQQPMTECMRVYHPLTAEAAAAATVGVPSLAVPVTVQSVPQEEFEFVVAGSGAEVVSERIAEAGIGKD